MNESRFALGLLMLALSSATIAATPCTPTVEQGWIRRGPPGATMLAGYALLRNRCATPQSVRSVASQDFAATTMHETLVENGVSKMREVGAVTIPAGGIATFQPGGRHLMLMRPKRDLHTGDRVVLRFKLVDGREVRADFVIREQAPK